MTRTDDRVPPRWARVLAVAAPVLSWPVGLAMAAQWDAGAGRSVDDVMVPQRWVAQALPVLDAAGQPVAGWRELYFLVVLAALPFAWLAVRRATATPRWLVRGGLAVAVAAITVEYNTADGYGWLIDLTGLLAALVGTVWYGVQILRRATAARPAGWALVAALPLTPLAGVAAAGYLPPALALGLLIAWAVAAATWSQVSASSRATNRVGATLR